jgi:hypothetical protein
MKTVVEILSTVIGRAMRADINSKDESLPRSQQHFHAGRREAYLQTIALINDTEVRDIREGVLGSKNSKASEQHDDQSDWD